MRAFQTRGEAGLLPEIRAVLAAFRSSVKADQAGIEELTPIRSRYVRRLSALKGRLLIAAYFEEHGIFTPAYGDFLNP